MVETRHSGGEYHADFKLKQTKLTEEVVLSNSDTVIIDNIPLGITALGHSWAQVPTVGQTWRICGAPTQSSSNNGSLQYLAYAERPAVDVTGGILQRQRNGYHDQQSIKRHWRYTTDGDNVTATDPEWPGSMAFSQTTVLKLRSFSQSSLIHPSFQEFNTYFIDETFTLPVWSCAADDVVDLANGQGSLMPIGSLEYFGRMVSVLQPLTVS